MLWYGGVDLLRVTAALHMRRHAGQRFCREFCWLAG